MGKPVGKCKCLHPHLHICIEPWQRRNRAPENGRGEEQVRSSNLAALLRTKPSIQLLRPAERWMQWDLSAVRLFTIGDSLDRHRTENRFSFNQMRTHAVAAPLFALNGYELFHHTIMYCALFSAVAVTATAIELTVHATNHFSLASLKHGQISIERNDLKFEYARLAQSSRTGSFRIRHDINTYERGMQDIKWNLISVWLQVKAGGRESERGESLWSDSKIMKWI